MANLHSNYIFPRVAIASSPQLSLTKEMDNTTKDKETRRFTKSVLLSKIPTGVVSYRPKKEFRLDSSFYMSMNKSELEENLEKMNHSTLVSAYIQLMDKLRMAEGQLDNKEKLLKGYQMKLEENEEQKNLLAFDLNEVRSHLRKQETLLNNSREDDFGFYDKCRYQTVGCKFEVPKIIYHERNECQFRPLRCPSLTCEETPSLHGLWKHINELHNGNTKGKDKICHNDTNHLVSSYVNIDNEPIFYKKNKMSWVTNEMQYDGKRFFLECMRIPPNWHLWVYFIGSTVEASRYAATIALFREEEYKRLSSENGLTSQRSFTGPVIPIHISKDEIGEKGLGFMVHDNQIKPLCGRLNNSHEEQLFGYEVTVYGKEM